ncbi:MAG: aspartate aminotransferase family protein, partial [Actinobacteria bacterium]
MFAKQRFGASADQVSARAHLLLNFTDFSNFEDRPIPIMVRGDGLEVIDSNGRRYLDGLSGLFCTNLGHGYGAEVGAAAQRQLSEMVYSPNWSLTHPAAVHLAERLTDAAEPLGMTRLFLTSGGGEAVEAAWKLVRQWHLANGQPQRHKA